MLVKEVAREKSRPRIVVVYELVFFFGFFGEMEEITD